MKVVLDSNIIIADFWMQSPSFKILFENSKNEKIDLYIPEIVLDEIKNKFSQRLEKSHSDINSEIIKFNKLTNLDVTTTISKELVARGKHHYSKHLKKIIKTNKIKIIEYPNTSHKYLVNKAMLNLKPFNSNEKGYRDCLIWENIKSLISKEDDEIIALPELTFITNNHKDFGGDDNILHESLITELEQENLNTNSIVIYPSLSEFNDRVSKLFLSQASVFENKLKNNDFDGFDLKSIIDEYLFKHFIHSDLYNYYEYAPYANDAPTVSTINDDYKIENISVKKLNSKQFIVDVQFNLETEIDYYIDKSDYWSNDDIDVGIIDSDWNDHVMAVSRLVDLPIAMTLIINSKLECISCEINKIDNDYEY